MTLAPILAEEAPFSSEYKFMATPPVHESHEENDEPGKDDSLIVHVKGASDMISCVSSLSRSVLRFEERAA